MWHVVLHIVTLWLLVHTQAGDDCSINPTIYGPGPVIYHRNFSFLNWDDSFKLQYSQAMGTYSSVPNPQYSCSSNPSNTSGKYMRKMFTFIDTMEFVTNFGPEDFPFQFSAAVYESQQQTIFVDVYNVNAPINSAVELLIGVHPSPTSCLTIGN